MQNSFRLRTALSLMMVAGVFSLAAPAQNISKQSVLPSLGGMFSSGVDNGADEGNSDCQIPPIGLGDVLSLSGFGAPNQTDDDPRDNRDTPILSGPFQLEFNLLAARALMAAQQSQDDTPTPAKR